MKSIRACVAACLICFAYAFACNNTAENAAMEPAPDSTSPVAPEAKSEETNYQLAGADKAAPPDGNKQQPNPGQPNVAIPVNMDWEKKIIKNADLRLEVTDYNAYNQLVHAGVKQLGGYIATEEQQSSEYKKENTLSIRVPVDQFDNVVNQLSSGKEKVIIKKITSQDVTGEVVDTRARMEAKRQIRQRYMDLLKQAKNMEEILQVQNVINDIQVQIESASGRINYLTHASALSTIQLSFFQVLDATAVDNHKPAFGDRVLDSLKSGLVWVGDLLVLLLNLWPLAVLGIMVYWAFKRWRSTRLKTPAN